MEFIKMHGIGNDYVYVDCFRNPAPKDPAGLSVKVSKFHTGIGSDGLILMLPDENADARMRIFNKDGSEGEMCGNGIRCMGKYLYDSGLVKKKVMTIATGGGIRTLEVFTEGGEASQIRVDMGKPQFAKESVSIAFPDGKTAMFTPLSFGNPHAVTLDRFPADDISFERDGKLVETHPLFPGRVNASFVRVLDSTHLIARIWERGSGATLACGSGACATLAAAARAGACERKAYVSLPGGDLFIEWDENTGCVFMTGPAEISFTGNWRE